MTIKESMSENDRTREYHRLMHERGPSPVPKPAPDLRQEIQKLVLQWNEDGQRLASSFLNHAAESDHHRAVVYLACARELERLLS
jgi:hypothetical protein